MFVSLFKTMVSNSDEIIKEDDFENYNDYISEKFTNNDIWKIDPLYHIQVDNWKSAKLTDEGIAYFEGKTEDDTALLASSAVGTVGKYPNNIDITFTITENRFGNKQLQANNIVVAPITNKVLISLNQLGIIRSNDLTELYERDLKHIEAVENAYVFSTFIDSIIAIKKAINVLLDIKENFK